MKFLLLIPLVVLLLRILRGVWSNRNIEKPEILSTIRIGPIERREVAPMLTANVLTSGSQNEALNAWFSQLAGYIFWENTTQKSIKMTAPVSTTASKTIAMTAPVAATKTWDTYKISFMVPRSYTMDTVPTPTNPNIFFEEVPATYYYVRSFEGRAWEHRAQKQLTRFKAALEQYDLTTDGNFILNQYNDPRTPPRMRTNERWGKE